MSAHPDNRPMVRELHVCERCVGHLVYPVDWCEHGDVRWEIILRCPECEWVSIDVYAQDVVDRFGEELDRGTDALVRDLRQLTRSNMGEEADRLARALAAGALLPEDF